ncbi:MAG: tRNA uridine-5-carboxymethylaminomethyl(34) synthesis GTPase MnmE [Cypionkella sp.]|jgi:tRNA modification GTPase|nr:tRNA uridine-5-carboxymethylaminomethyl(34) synthesis GTPase MnmE [Cypionkella sp.]
MADTIFALATARGKAGIAIVRVSGPDALRAAAALGVIDLRPRRAMLRDIFVRGEILDSCIVVFFEEKHSFTGEAVVEFQVHGSEAVVASLLAALGTFPGLRGAKPGEFTRRALENGMLDLTQVEGLADLIDAETEAQRRQAQRVLSGAIGQRAQSWREDLVRAAALIEVTIDFADEDVPVDVTPEVREIVDRLHTAFLVEIDRARVAERIRAGFEVAIIGAPNVGKSSLLNALAGRDVAITSPIPGTTRDIIELRMDLGGIPVTLLDTAGVREAEDPIEKIGVARTMERAATADLRVFLLGPDNALEGDLPGKDVDDLVVFTKSDLSGRSDAISSKTGAGLDRLVEQIKARLEGRVSGSGLLIRERQRAALSQAAEAMANARLCLYAEHPRLELAAADLRAAAHALDMLVGKIGVETLLGEIFSRFCIGK